RGGARGLPPIPPPPRGSRTQGMPPVHRSWWKGALLALACLVAAGLGAAAGASRIGRILFPSPPVSGAESIESAPDFAAALALKSASEGGDSLSYARDIAPLVSRYCIRCHSGEKPKGGVSLDRDKNDAAVRNNRRLWEKVADNLRSGE